MGIIDNYLPHKKPVRFIEEVLEEGEEYAISLVVFHEKPTLSAMVEAAAQNIIFISSLNSVFDGGVLTLMKNINLLNELEPGTYKVSSEMVARIDNYATFKFNVSIEDEAFVNGEINLVMNRRIL